MDKLMVALVRFDPRLMLLSMVCILCLVAAEGWILFLAKPVIQYRQLASARSSTAATLRDLPGHQAQLRGLATELGQRSEHLAGGLHALGSDDEMAAVLMSELDRAAAKNGVVLTAVKPSGRRQVQGFEELAFEVSAQGKYLMLCRWLTDFENVLGQNAAVTEFRMESADDGRQVSMALTVALYRQAEIAGARK